MSFIMFSKQNSILLRFLSIFNNLFIFDLILNNMHACKVYLFRPKFIFQPIIMIKGIFFGSWEREEFFEPRNLFPCPLKKVL